MIELLILIVLPTILIFLYFACSEMNEDRATSHSRDLERFARKLSKPDPEPIVEKKAVQIQEKPVVKKKAVKKDIVKPKPEVKIDSKKLKDFSDILRAIGFSASEAKQKVTKLLTENPDATEIELLRKATDK